MTTQHNTTTTNIDMMGWTLLLATPKLEATIAILALFSKAILVSSLGSNVSSDPWRLKSITFKNQNIETAGLLSDFLLELGAASTSIVDHDRDTDMEKPIFGQHDDDRGLENGLHEKWQPFQIWHQSNVSAQFPASFDVTSIVESVRIAFDLAAAPRYEIEGVEDKDWVLHVQESWKPCVVADHLVLRFPWHTDSAVAEACQCAGVESISIPKRRQVLLQGGIAFGTGDHPTTRLCLNWVVETMDSIEKKRNEEEGDDEESKSKKLFLDYGAGSGVLGLAACAVASSDNFEAIGVEIDSDAILIADANAEANGLPMRSFLPKIDRSRLDDESLSVALRARSRMVLPEEFNAPVFDGCVANILAGPLCQLAPVIASHLKPGAPLGMSGVLQYLGDDVVAAYAPFFDDCHIESEEEGWVLVTGLRNENEVTKDLLA